MLRGGNSIAEARESGCVGVERVAEVRLWMALEGVLDGKGVDRHVDLGRDVTALHVLT